MAEQNGVVMLYVQVFLYRTLHPATAWRGLEKLALLSQQFNLHLMPMYIHVHARKATCHAQQCLALGYHPPTSEVFLLPQRLFCSRQETETQVMVVVELRHRVAIHL